MKLFKDVIVCRKCGKKYSSNSNFCPNCGEPADENLSSSRQVYAGQVKKCPNCGEVLGSFEAKCPTCGYEIFGASANSNVKLFANQIQELESKRVPDVGFKGFMSKVGLAKKDTTDEQIVSLIMNYPVPNTKEDCYEFMVLASSNINLDALTNASEFLSEDEEKMKRRSEAWLSKAKQIYEKSKLSFGNDPDFGYIQTIYDKLTGNIRKSKSEQSVKSFFQKIGPSLGIILMGVLPIFYFGSLSIQHTNKERKFEALVEEINIDIQNGDYDSALVKANSLHMDDGWSDESEKHWDEQREYLIEIIKNAKEGN